MLLFVAAWLVLLAVSLPTGAAILRWTDPAGAVFDRPGDRFVLCAWLGLLVLGAGLLAVSFLFPLSPIVGAVVGFGAAVAALSWRGVRDELSAFRARLNRRLIAAMGALMVGVGLFTAQPVVWFDTGLYHASAIRWLSEFGAVDGVALVKFQLGFGSSWFALAAPFNPEGLRDHAVAVMGGFALLLLSLHALICVWRALQRRARLADWLQIAGAALLILGLAAIVKLHVTPSPDLPVDILALLVGWAIFTVANAPRRVTSIASRFSPGPAAVPLLLALGAMTVKPQAAALVAVAAPFYALHGERRLRRGLWVVGLGTVLLAPWVAYEYVVTGCPAYPLPVCADVAWSVGPEAARDAAEATQNFPRERIAPGSSGLGWVGPWLTDDLSPALGFLAVASVLAVGGGLLAGSQIPPSSGRRRIATWVVIAGALGLFVFLLRTEEILMVTLACVSLIPLARRHPGTGWLLALGLAGVAMTLFAAPDPRFAYGYMAVLFARLAVFQGPWLWLRLRRYLTPPERLPAVGLPVLLAAAAILAGLGPLLRPTTPLSEGPGLVVPAEIPDSVAVVPRNGVPYRVPNVVNGLCWQAELPCTIAQEIDPAVRLRDPDEGIEGGFSREAGSE